MEGFERQSQPRNWALLGPLLGSSPNFWLHHGTPAQKLSFPKWCSLRKVKNLSKNPKGPGADAGASLAGGCPKAKGDGHPVSGCPDWWCLSQDRPAPAPGTKPWGEAGRAGDKDTPGCGSHSSHSGWAEPFAGGGTALLALRDLFWWPFPHGYQPLGE